MKVFIEDSDSQLVLVQNAFLCSLSIFTARLPSARFACRAIRIAMTRNAGKYIHDRTRRRVTETTGINLPSLGQTFTDSLAG